MNQQAGNTRGSKWAKAIAALLIILPLLVISLYALHITWIYEVFNYSVSMVEKGLGLNKHLARALAAVFWVPFLYFVREALSVFSRKRRLIGLLGISAYVAVYSVLAWQASKDVYFDAQTGQAVRWYALTPEGYRFYDEPGVDETYGIPLEPATKEIVEAARGGSSEMVAYVSLEEVPYLFDPVTGAPQVWYAGDPEGDIRFYSRGGFDPLSGQKLKPVNAEVVDAYHAARQSEEQLARQKAESEEQAVQQKIKGEADRKARTQEEQARRAFRERYTYSSVIDRLDRQYSWVLVAVTGAGSDLNVQGLLGSAMQERGIAARSGLLRPAVFNRDIYETLSQGDPALLRRLGLDRLSGHLLLGRFSASDARESSVGGLMSAQAQLSLTVVPLSGKAPTHEKFSMPGSGISEADAVEMAAKRIIDEALQDPILMRLKD